MPNSCGAGLLPLTVGFDAQHGADSNEAPGQLPWGFRVERLRELNLRSELGKHRPLGLRLRTGRRASGDSCPPLGPPPSRSADEPSEHGAVVEPLVPLVGVGFGSGGHNGVRTGLDEVQERPGDAAKVARDTGW